MGKKPPKIKTRPQLDSLLKSYALRRLQETPGAAGKPAKRMKPTTKKLKKG